MVLVQLSVVEPRLDAVRAVLAAATATEVAASVGVSRQSVHTWIGQYLVDGLADLAERSRRPASCPHQVSAVVEVHVAEMRREHPRWGAKRIRMELLRKPVAGLVAPSTATINRILTRQHLVVPRPRKRPGIPTSAGSGRVGRPPVRGSFVPRTMFDEARQVTIPLQVLLQWDDQGNDRQMALDLFGAFGSTEKTLHANLGGHTGVPSFEPDASAQFFARHLS